MTPPGPNVGKLIDYAQLPSLRLCILLQQTAEAATVSMREPSGPQIATAQTGGAFE